MADEAVLGLLEEVLARAQSGEDPSLAFRLKLLEKHKHLMEENKEASAVRKAQNQGILRHSDPDELYQATSIDSFFPPHIDSHKVRRDRPAPPDSDGSSTLRDLY